MFIAIFLCVCIFHSEPLDHNTGTFLARDKKIHSLFSIWVCVCVGWGGGGVVIFFSMIWN